MNPEQLASYGSEPFEFTGSNGACNWWDVNCILKSNGLPPLPPSVATPFTPWTGPPGQPNPYMPFGGSVAGGSAPSWAQSFLGDTTIWQIAVAIAAVGGMLLGIWVMFGSPEVVPVPA